MLQAAEQVAVDQAVKSLDKVDERVTELDITLAGKRSSSPERRSASRPKSRKLRSLKNASSSWRQRFIAAAVGLPNVRRSTGSWTCHRNRGIGASHEVTRGCRRA